MIVDAVSGQFELVFGYTAADLVRRGWSVLVHPADRGVHEYLTARVLAGDEISGELRHVTKSGEVLQIAFVTTPEKDATGRVVRLHGAGHDVTRERAIEDRLREDDRRKDVFVAVLAHELRNALAPIQASVEVLGLDASGPSTLRARGVLERQVHHMVRLVDDLLDISRITRGELQLRRSHVDLVSVLDQALDRARPHFERAGHELVVELPTSPVIVDVDGARMSQVVSNLLHNAAKYMDPGGTARLTAEIAAGELVLTVRDRGIGIPPAQLARVFEMFSQLEETRARSQGGLGIGLALVRAIVEMHGGHVRARSEGHGQGTEIEIRLPVVVAH